MANTPLTIRIPIRGKVLLRLDGFDDLHEVGAFTQEVNVAFQPGAGEVSFQFDEKFWRGNIKPDRGVEPPTPKEPDWFCRCGHLWTTHNIHVGCTAEWLYDAEGIATTDGCECQLAHVDKSGKELR